MLFRSEIVDGVVKHKDGSSVDKEFRDGAKKALEILKDKGAELLKAEGFNVIDVEEL